jgi:squalene synthase HpnC
MDNANANRKTHMNTAVAEEQRSATLKAPTKTGEDENFPVASWLIPAELRPHVRIFYLCVRAADDVADDPDRTPEQKSELLARMDEALQGDVDRDTVNGPAIDHRQSAVETSVPLDHARHLLQAFVMDVTKNRYRNWSDLLNYCRYSAAPVGRFLVDLHGCGDAPKAATDALCAALQILNHLQDCKDDYLALNRVYLPLDMLRAAGTSVEELNATRSTPEMRAALDAILDRTDELIRHAWKAPSKISHPGLRYETAVIIAIAEKLSAKLRRRDPVAGRVELSSLQKLLCVTRGLWRGWRATP